MERRQEVSSGGSSGKRNVNSEEAQRRKAGLSWENSTGIGAQALRERRLLKFSFY